MTRPQERHWVSDRDIRIGRTDASHRQEGAAMATIMKSLKRNPTVRWELWEVVFRTIGITACIIVPGVDLVRSHYFQQGSSPVDPWQYGLLGLGALLVVIYERLKL